MDDVFNDYGINVLSNGTVLQERDIERLQHLGIEYVEIEIRFNDPDAYLHKTVTSESIRNLQPKYSEAVHVIRDVFEKVRVEGKFDSAEIEESFDPLVENFSNEKDVVSLLLALNTKDDYTYQHSVQVGMISYYLAKWLGKPEDECAYIGKAGYLHDIGKSKIPQEILQKPARLTDEEFALIQKHTVYGYEILNESVGFGSDLSLVALQHHERIKGGGYPLNITGEAMHPYSKIIAVADVYSAMISTRVYQKKRDLLAVLKELHRGSFDELDPLVTHTFIRNMIPNFIGKKVVFKDGQSGEIVMTNPQDYFRPLVRIQSEFIDLSRHPEYEIEMIYT